VRSTWHSHHILHFFLLNICRSVQVNSSLCNFPIGVLGFDSRRWRPERLWGLTSLLSNGHQGLLPWGWSGRCVKLTTHLHLLPSSKNAWSYIVTPPIRLHDVVIGLKKSTRTTLPLLSPHRPIRPTFLFWHLAIFLFFLFSNDLYRLMPKIFRLRCKIFMLTRSASAPPKVSLLWRSGRACVVEWSWELCRR
jgi:hypothetical protein